MLLGEVLGGWRGVMSMREVLGGVGRCDSCQEV